MQGFSNDVFRKDHPNDTSRGSVCLYYRENLLITRGDLEIHDDAIVCQISIKRKRFILLLCIGVLAKQLMSLACFSTD